MTECPVHVGFELDDVLTDHTEWKQMLARRLGYALSAAQTASDVARTILTADHHDELRRLLCADDRYALSPSLMDGARELLDAFTTAAMPFSLISRRSVPDLARLLLAKLGLDRYFSDRNTVFVRTRREKADVCARLGVTHYLDGQPSVLMMLTAVPHRFLLDPHGNFTGGPWAHVSTLQEFGMLVLPRG